MIASHSTMALAIGVIALSFARGAGRFVFGAGELLLGLSVGASNANEMGYKQSITPDHLQGR